MRPDSHLERSCGCWVVSWTVGSLTDGSPAPAPPLPRCPGPLSVASRGHTDLMPHLSWCRGNFAQISPLLHLTGQVKIIFSSEVFNPNIYVVSGFKNQFDCTGNVSWHLWETGCTATHHRSPSVHHPQGKYPFVLVPSSTHILRNCVVQ